MSIQEQLSEDQKAAMRAGDRATLNVIRQVRTEVSVASKAEGFSGEVDDDLYRDTITSYVKKMEKARKEFEAAGERGAENAAKLAFEIEYLSKFLPQKLGEQETRSLVKRVIAELGVSDPKEKGRVIGAVVKSGEEVDGGLVARLVTEELGG